MSQSALEQRISGLAIPVLVVTTVLLLAPFANKAFHIDDPLFLWSAKQIQSHPSDFYGFTVNWYGWEMPMSEVTKNPPGTSYFIALVAHLFGWSEIALHLAFLIPAVVVALGTYHLARGFCSRPALAALAGMLTPVFLLSSTSVMCDTMMLSFWLLAVLLWVRGVKRDEFLTLFLSALFITTCALTKYYGISLVPLLLLYSLAERRGLGRWALPLLIPLIIFGGYLWAGHALYGRNLLVDAASYATMSRWVSGAELLSKGLTSLAFTGGCLATALFFSPFLWTRRALAAGILLTALLIASMPLMETIGNFPLRDANGIRWSFVVQFALLTVAGASVLALAAADIWERRDASSLLLLLWIGGTFIFAGFINWTVNGRTILPMAPAAGILMMRRIDSRIGPSKPGNHWPLIWPLVPAAIVALAVSWSDYRLANSARAAAFQIHEKYGTDSGTVWFQGHWGFQYYMDSVGSKALDVKRSSLARGDIVVIPSNNSKLYRMPQGVVRLSQIIQLVPHRWLTTMNLSVGAGFYSDNWGPLPFALGSVPTEKYYVMLVSHPVRYQPR